MGSLRPDATRSGLLSEPSREDPKETFTLPEAGDEQGSSSSSSSSSDESSSDESHEDLLLPEDPVAEKTVWDPDFEMYQHRKSKIVHTRACGTQQQSFSCGVKLTSDYEQVLTADFLVFRKCKRCTQAKPIKDVGALASALKKRRLEFEAASAGK